MLSSVPLCRAAGIGIRLASSTMCSESYSAWVGTRIESEVLSSVHPSIGMRTAGGNKWQGSRLGTISTRFRAVYTLFTQTARRLLVRYLLAPSLSLCTLLLQEVAITLNVLGGTPTQTLKVVLVELSM